MYMTLTSYKPSVLFFGRKINAAESKDIKINILKNRDSDNNFILIFIKFF